MADNSAGRTRRVATEPTGSEVVSTPGIRSPSGQVIPTRILAAAIVAAYAFVAATVGGSSEPSRVRHGMVVASDPLAAEAGRNVLRAGGSAIDAAVATAFALAVTYPNAGNIGGGGFLVYRSAEGTAVTYDFRETAPAAAAPDMFLEGRRL